ncbi:TetR family transcriptional regulator [Nonomuraea mesophila]|uniref:TetR family transcriptional regulator n=1 Tax=Nonomuraea mesophila TaxID=2530382 RepID=A0A4R5FVH9_9ACTN|nr:helix-turn-helix domain-containing protein [Nonomuraea mesophila]TDE57700.1 TetR family transcriptional regulator [Nonomuraea mesophila]
MARSMRDRLIGSKDTLKRRIDEAAKFVDLDQVCISPQCGFSSTVEGNELAIDQQFAKLSLIVEAAPRRGGRPFRLTRESNECSYDSMESGARRSYRMGARAAAMKATRMRVMQAAATLWMRHWYDDVTLQDVADEADVSVQTIVNRFGGKEGLADAVADWVAAQTMISRQAPIGDVDAIVAVLFADYEGRGEGNVLWIAQMDRIPMAGRVAAHARDQHRAWLEQVFADRLPASGPAREHALNLHHAATDVYLWKLWRRDLGLSREDAERAMRDLLTSIDPRKRNNA